MSISLHQRPARILPIIILSQFAGGSLWFSGNAILENLIEEWNITSQIIGLITSAVQLGFIAGTLVFAWFTIADRYSPRKVFFTCSLLGAIANSLILFLPSNVISLIILRFCTGFFLAGIYPVGMKIASGWYRKELGEALGLLVGALVLGTAFPHILVALKLQLNWETVLITTSATSLLGGIAMLTFVPDGPYITRNSSFNGKTIFSIFKQKEVKAAAFGYFGHMWELYTLWAFLPFFLSTYILHNPGSTFSVPLWVFIIIASGSVGCAVGGVFSKRIGSAKVAFFQLAASGCCCMLSPLAFGLSPAIFIVFMTIWGITVAGDSPQYSTVIALKAPPHIVGSTLTLVNSIGFFITIVSIQLVDYLSSFIAPQMLFLILLPGPVLGLYSMRRLVRPTT